MACICKMHQQKKTSKQIVTYSLLTDILSTAFIIKRSLCIKDYALIVHISIYTIEVDLKCTRRQKMILNLRANKED